MAPIAHNEMLLEEFNKKSRGVTEFFGLSVIWTKKRCSRILLKSNQALIVAGGTPNFLPCAENSLMRCISFVWTIDAGNCSFIIIYSKFTFGIFPFYELKLSEVLN